MNKRTPVSEIMTKEIIIAHPGNTYSQVMEFFNTWKIQHLPITFADRLIGILSINDMIAFTYKHLSSGAKDFAGMDEKFAMREVMTSDPVSLAPDDTVEKAFSILSKGHFQSLPVCNDGILVGIITNKDLVRFYNEFL
ncbi:MAG TPA: CBS domain-containing protein [Ferruginibacter sp.]|nr:CBS domain-containing protein [Ferruginibacter sp.]HRO06547.1 CBS domain-containing protein [Ferruginibacter sp.]HRO96717.1 CBS domain-containing protein [Ferruginibacter sp.]HRP50153.1 CBS domain-containing protein [Ferruginibacter sp.]